MGVTVLIYKSMKSQGYVKDIITENNCSKFTVASTKEQAKHYSSFEDSALSKDMDLLYRIGDSMGFSFICVKD